VRTAFSHEPEAAKHSEDGLSRLVHGGNHNNAALC
jgi:hypothetical protein